MRSPNVVVIREHCRKVSDATYGGESTATSIIDDDEELR
jgi:hypothetical protein